jgi:hypothetical protein
MVQLSDGAADIAVVAACALVTAATVAMQVRTVFFIDNSSMVVLGKRSTPAIVPTSRFAELGRAIPRTALFHWKAGELHGEELLLTTPFSFTKPLVCSGAHCRSDIKRYLRLSVAVRQLRVGSIIFRELFMLFKDNKYPRCGRRMELALLPGGSDERDWQCFDCDRPDPLKDRQT